MIQDIEEFKGSFEELLEHLFGIKVTKVSQLIGFINKNYKVSTEKQNYIVKTYEDFNELQNIKTQVDFLLYLSKKSPSRYSGPIAFQKGGYLKFILWNEKKFLIRMLTYIQGTLLNDCEQKPSLYRSLGDFVGQFFEDAKDYEFKGQQLHYWTLDQYEYFQEKLYVIKSSETKEICQFFIEAFKNNVLTLKDKLRKQTLHGDINEFNMLCKNNEVVGMIDFADLSYSHLVYDIGITLFYMLYDRKEYFTIAESFLQGLSTKIKFNQEEVFTLYYLIGLRAAQSLVITTATKQKDPQNEYLDTKNDCKEQFLKNWKNLNPKQVEERFKKVMLKQ